MTCPLLLIGVFASPSKDGLGDADANCRGSHCAWWEAEYKGDPDGFAGRREELHKLDKPTGRGWCALSWEQPSRADPAAKDGGGP